MSLVKEPEGIDFIIQSPPLTDNERKEISEFILTKKMQNKRQVNRTNSKKTARTNALKMPNA